MVSWFLCVPHLLSRMHQHPDSPSNSLSSPLFCPPFTQDYPHREMTGAATFRWILQLHKDVPKAARFYSEGLDFTVNVCTLRWAELQSGSLKLSLMQSHKNYNFAATALDKLDEECISDGELLFGFCHMGNVKSNHLVQKGYSSLLSFTVTDINTTVTKLMALGAELDGPIKYEIHGKVAAMRCIDGHMLGLYEPA